MSTHFVLRAAATVAAVAGFIIITTTRALAAVDPGLGEGSGSVAPPAPPPAPLPFEVFGMAWQGALALGIALIAVVGLAYSVQHRRHAAGAPA